MSGTTDRPDLFHDPGEVSEWMEAVGAMVRGPRWGERRPGAPVADPAERLGRAWRRN